MVFFRLGLMVLVLSTLLGPAFGKQQLRVWYSWNVEEMPGRLAAFHKFEKDHDVTVQVTRMTGHTHYNPQDQKLMCAIAGGAPPDVVLQDRFTIGGWASRGAFQSLDPFIERDWKAGIPNAVTAGCFYPAAWRECMFRGKIYGIPASIDCRVMYSNLDLLEAAAEDPAWQLRNPDGSPRPPQTWQELDTHLGLLNRRDSNDELYTVGFLPDQGNSHLYLYGWLNGGKFMDMAENRCTLNDPRIVEALEYLCNLYRFYSDTGDEPVEGRRRAARFTQAFQGGVNQPFLEGKVALWVDTNAYLTTIARYKPEFRFQVTPVPHPADRPAGTWSGGWALVMPRGVTGEQAELAWEFIRWMSSPDCFFLMSRHQRDYNRSKGRVAITSLSGNHLANQLVHQKLTSHDPDLAAPYQQALETVLDLLPKAFFRPVTPVGQFLWNRQVNAFELASFGKATPQQILDRYTREVDREIARIETTDPDVPTWLPRLGILLALVLVGAMLLVVSSRQRRLGRMHHQEFWWGMLFVSPWLVGFLVLSVGPILYSLFLSFTQFDGLHQPQWVGLRNYRSLMHLKLTITSWNPLEWESQASDPLFWKSLLNTAVMLLTVPLSMIVGLAIALVLQQERKITALYRTLCYLPAIVPLVASSVLWVYVLQPEGGLLNNMLEAVLPIEGPDWLAGEHTAKPAIMLMLVWGSGGTMIIWLAGLKNIGPQYYESAEIDGAGMWAKLFHITLPMLTPYILYNLVIGTIAILQLFTQAMVMTYGGPANATLFYAFYLFNNAFYWFRMGIASAMAWVLLLITLVLTIVQLRFARIWVHYEGEDR